MKTRVRPLHESRLYSWTVQIYDPVDTVWVENSEHYFFWMANWRANRLTKYNLDIKMNNKGEFVRKLKEGEDDSSEI
jgi:hypothetical protein